MSQETQPPIVECQCLDGVANVSRIALEMGRTIFDQLPLPERTRLQSLIRKPAASNMDEFADSFVYLPEEIKARGVEGQVIKSMHRGLAANLGLGLGWSRIIDEAKISILGRRGNTDASNALISKTMERLAFGTVAAWFGDPTNNERVISHQDSIAPGLLNKKGTEWFMPKVKNYFSAARNALSIFNVLSSTEHIEEAETQALHNENNRLFEASKLLQRYGVKPAVIPSPTPNAYVNEWNVQPTKGVRDRYKELIDSRHTAFNYTQHDTIATFYSTSGEFSTSVMGVALEKKGVVEFGQLTLPPRTHEPNGTILMISLDKTGHLQAPNGLSLREFCQENNATAEYEQLRAEILCMYFDLVTPVSIQKLVDQEVELSELEDATEIASQPTEAAGKLRRLILARRKIIEIFTSEELEEEMQKELDEARADAISRQMTRHPVIGHIRKLNPKHKASLEARLLCLEDLDVELADYGETYVREHHRGSIEEAEFKGHKAAFQPDSKTANLKEKRHRPPKKQKGGRYTPPKSKI